MAIELAEKFDGNCSMRLIETFCKYLDISIDDFYETLIKATNKELFQIDYSEKIPKLTRKFKVGIGIQ